MTDTDIREKVARAIFEAKYSNVGGEWKWQGTKEKEHWFTVADAVLSAIGYADLKAENERMREALESASGLLQIPPNQVDDDARMLIVRSVRAALSPKGDA